MSRRGVKVRKVGRECQVLPARCAQHLLCPANRRSTTTCCPLPTSHPRRPQPCTTNPPLCLQAALDNLRWGADYLMACHTGDDQYVAQIGDPGPGQHCWCLAAAYWC